MTIGTDSTITMAGDLTVVGDIINFSNIPSDSTAATTGQLWFNSTTGAIHRKF